MSARKPRMVFVERGCVRSRWGGRWRTAFVWEGATDKSVMHDRDTCRAIARSYGAAPEFRMIRTVPHTVD